MRAKPIAYQNSNLMSQSNLLLFRESQSLNWLKKIGEFLVKAFDQSYELKIEQKVDRQGNVCWEIYDPTHRQSYWFYSESDVRTWIDRRFI